MRTIGEAINQSKFKNDRQKAYINILYTASFLSASSSKILKPFGISVQQYNILRILKGQHPKPASIKSLTERMLDKMSNASRLVEKLKSKGLVERVECPDDRRQVNIGINQQGLELLEKMTESMNLGFQVMDHLTDDEAVLLSDLLDKIRS